MQRAFELAGNASAIHRGGRAARAVVDDAREQVARLVNANANDVVFTSGGSEANALALWGAVHGAIDSRRPVTRLLVSEIEHDSVLKTAAAIAERTSGIDLVLIPATPDGVVDVKALEQRLAESNGRALVAAMAANNETGVIQPAHDVVSLAQANTALCLVDAVQACGKMAIDFVALGADYMTLSAHKFGGPQGVGALVMKADAPIAPQMSGAQERGRRAGTENVVGIAGFGAAAECAVKEDVSFIPSLRDRFETGLKSRFPEVVVFGQAAPRLVNTSNFAIPERHCARSRRRDGEFRRRLLLGQGPAVACAASHGRVA